MENLAHSLTGLAIAMTPLGQRVPYASLTLLAAANAPDLDVLVSWAGPLHYIHYHRGITHGLIGTLLIGVLLGLLAWWFRSRSHFNGGSFLACVGTTVVTALTHPLLDFTNSYGIQPFLPISESRYFGDLAFIIDPFIWLILGTGVFLASYPRRWISLTWGAIAAAMLAFGVFATYLLPRAWVFVVLLLVAVVCVIPVRRHFGPLPKAAGASLAVLAGYWLFLWGSNQLASHRAGLLVVKERPDFAQAGLSAIPRPIDLFSWDVFVDRGDAFLIGAVSALRNGPVDWQFVNRNLGRPEVHAALRTCPGQILAQFGRFEYYEVTTDSQGPGVVFRDARFSRQTETGFGTFTIRLTPGTLLDRTGEPCPAP